ncbi:MAG: hypothetical protein NTV94_09225 [Planctomycetota bacterium]|nr:hypothetical protein [Planctomycetota bacterium]
MFLMLLTLLLGWASRPEPLPRVRVDYDRRADVSFHLGELDNMTIHPDHLLCMGWMVDGPRPEGIRDYEYALRVWGITSLIGGDQYSLVLKDVPAAWIRENFSRGLLAGGWISRPEGIQLPAAVMIMSSQRTIVCVDTLNLIGPVNSDWEMAHSKPFKSSRSPVMCIWSSTASRASTNCAPCRPKLGSGCTSRIGMTWDTPSLSEHGSSWLCVLKLNVRRGGSQHHKLQALLHNRPLLPKHDEPPF